MGFCLCVLMFFWKFFETLLFGIFCGFQRCLCHPPFFDILLLQENTFLLFLAVSFRKKEESKNIFCIRSNEQKKKNFHAIFFLLCHVYEKKKPAKKGGNMILFFLSRIPSCAPCAQLAKLKRQLKIRESSLPRLLVFGKRVVAECRKKPFSQWLTSVLVYI